ncbi:molybdenum cofactor biosynthesis protein B [Haladaptatus litoreus]|uniref:Molybdenum cofactor biosynthesis protein B n=1 Tax=Haladaptatus litoreus TaxID=553468 RepID=A0A1N7B3C3_9EURY|nr:molybdenum cofactor synthesis domain-containing protein [Haladaptatus litoreus]SIR45723.1 molybdenum cofactor biosynthesis protein B [Haladaptatus litoreus]
MVDFQSRDTRRAPVNEEDETEDETAEKNEDSDGRNENEERQGDEQQHDAEHQHDDDEQQHDDQHHHVHDRGELGFGVVTVSSSRSLDEDSAGDAIAELVENDGHDTVTRELVPDDYDTIQKTVDNLIGRKDVDVVVTTGGTGVTPDDVTIEAVTRLLEKELPGFGELFRTLSYDEIGTKVVGTRATAGVVDGVVVCCLPGSENAVRLGTEEILLPEVGHLVGLSGRE